MLAFILHYFGLSIAVFLSACGVGIGQGLIGSQTADSSTRQPMGGAQRFTAMIIGLAITETGGILGLVIASILLMGRVGQALSLGCGLAELGIGLVVGVCAAVVGIAAGYMVSAAIAAIGRQPLFGSKILTLMLIVLSFIEAPVIFSFIVALLVNLRNTASISVYSGFYLFGSCLVLALGCIGPIIGQSIFGHNAMRALGNNTHIYSRLFTYALICIAVIETPIIFSLLLAFLFLYGPQSAHATCSGVVVLLSAAIAMGVGALGAGVANGYVAARGCEQIAANESSYGAIFRTTMISVTIIESAAIYSFIIALFLFSKIF